MRKVVTKMGGNFVLVMSPDDRKKYKLVQGSVLELQVVGVENRRFD